MPQETGSRMKMPAAAVNHRIQETREHLPMPQGTGPRMKMPAAAVNHRVQKMSVRTRDGSTPVSRISSP